ncbi:MAG: hypothetical protein WCV50_01030 [Patescibacteria group bacterium]|jgi:hypothetical protein
MLITEKIKRKKFPIPEAGEYINITYLGTPKRSDGPAKGQIKTRVVKTVDLRPGRKCEVTTFVPGSQTSESYWLNYVHGYWEHARDQCTISISGKAWGLSITEKNALANYVDKYH